MRLIPCKELGLLGFLTYIILAKSGAEEHRFLIINTRSAQPYVDMFYLPCILQIIIGRLTNFIINLS